MATIWVFVENPAGSAVKHHFDEKLCVLRSVSQVSRPYPHHYGFVLNTDAADGDNLDCFILSDRELATGDRIECEILGLMEQVEDGVADHKIIARPIAESVELTSAVADALCEFVTHVFDHIEGKVVRPGRFLGVEAALRHLASCQH